MHLFRMWRIWFCLLCVMALVTPSFAMAASTGPGLTPEEALAKLREGNARFTSGRAVHPRQDAARLKETAKGQTPFATILGCSDSRESLELLFDQGVGDIFAVRVAGNVADTDEIGSIEYGVGHLHTPVLLVLGHTSCGAVTAVAQGAQVHGSIPELVDNIIPAVAKARAEGASGDALIAKAIELNVWQSIEDVLRRSDEVRTMAREGKVQVLGAVYDLHGGGIRWMGHHPEEARLLAVAGGGGHGTAVSGQGGTAGGHTGAKISLADAATLEILKADTLKIEEHKESHAEKPGLSRWFWLFVGVMAALSLAAAALALSGVFRHMGIARKLGVSFGGLVLLAGLLGLASYHYLTYANDFSDLAKTLTEADMAGNEAVSAQRAFLLYGLENRAYGDAQAAKARASYKESREFLDAAAQTGLMNEAQRTGAAKAGGLLDEAVRQFEDVVRVFHAVEKSQEELEHAGEAIEKAITGILHKARAAGGETSAKARQLAALAELEAVSLKLDKAELEFLMDKKAALVGEMEQELGLLVSLAAETAGMMRDPAEAAMLRDVGRMAEGYAKELRDVVKDEATLKKDTAELRHAMAGYDQAMGDLSAEVDATAEAAVGEAEMAVLLLLVFALLAGSVPAVFIARAISMPLKAGLEFARNMAKGDFSRELTAVASRDEAGQRSMKCCGPCATSSPRSSRRPRTWPQGQRRCRPRPRASRRGPRNRPPRWRRSLPPWSR